MCGKVKSGKCVACTADNSVSGAAYVSCNVAAVMGSTDPEELLAVVLCVGIKVVFKRNGGNVCKVVKRTVFNKAYGCGNGKRGCGVRGRTVKENGRNAVTVFCLVKNAVDRNVHVVHACGNGNGLKRSTAGEELGHITYIEHTAKARGGTVDRAVKLCSSCGEVYGFKL